MEERGIGEEEMIRQRRAPQQRNWRQNGIDMTGGIRNRSWNTRVDTECKVTQVNTERGPGNGKEDGEGGWERRGRTERTRKGQREKVTLEAICASR